MTSVAGAVVGFAPALTNGYVQNTAAQPRRTYQVIRVPQLPSASISGAAPVTALAWDGTVGGVAALDVAGQISFTGTGPHIDASSRGFRGGAQGVPNSNCCAGNYWFMVSAATADGGGKGEGIAGTPRYVNASTQGSYNNGTRFSDAVAPPTDLGAGNMGYTNGDFARGAPANAGGGGTSHNSGGGGGGNGGAGGNGGQTFNGDGLRDVGGYGGARTPQDGVLSAARIFMGGGGGSGSLNNDSGNRGHGGRGGGIILLRAGQISGSALLRADGQRGWDSDASNDTGGGGGAGGSVMVIAGAGHGSVQVEARGGEGGNSNMTNGSLAFAPPAGDQGGCCGGEREGPGGGGGGGVSLSNAALGSVNLAGSINGLSREDKAAGFSGNMLAAPGSAGASAIVTSASTTGARPGFECKPTLAVTKLTTTPARTVPPDVTGQYSIRVDNPALGSGVAYGVALTDLLSVPFTLTGTTATLGYSGGASGPASPMTISGTSSVAVGTAGHPTNAFTLPPGGGVTVTFNVGLNSAAAGTYQNPGSVRFTDPTRATGSSVTGATNPAIGPGDGFATGGGSAGGSNYAAASSTAEDIVIAGTPGTSADVSVTKTGPASVAVGDPVAYTLVLANSGPGNLTSGLVLTDNVPALVGTVTWVCSLTGGSGDCDVALGGTAASGSGSAVVLSNAQLASGGQLQVVISGVAASAGTITNTTTVALPAGWTDPTPGNNTATAVTTVLTRTADLSVTKTDGVASLASGAVTAYTIVVGNAGPSAADGATVTDPAATGLAKLSISCSAAGGASCPGGLTTSTFQAGVAIPLLPAGGTVTFTLNAQVTAATGTVTNTVSVSTPAGVTDTNAANNGASDANALVAATAAVVSAAQICPAGTTEQLTNLLTNSDFADTSAATGTSALQYPLNTNIDDAAGFAPAAVGPQSGTRTPGNYMNQRPFPGDAARSVAGATNWLYSNGNTGQTTAFRVWKQSVSGLVSGRNYEFLFYGSNARNIGSGTGNTPLIEPRATVGTTTYTLGTAVNYPNHPAGTSDTWVIQQSLFTATATSADLEIWDTRAPNANAGDNWAVTQILLRECRPNADPFVTKTNGTNTVQTFGTTAYVITVGNNGPGPADSIVLTDPATAGLTKTGISCAAFGTGAQCPLSVSLSGLEDTGLTIPTLPSGTTVLLTITATVTAISGSVTNTASLGLPFGLVDSNLANNSATDVDAVRGLANITVSKTNGTTTLVAGQTTSYTVTVANLGPSAADGAVLVDPAVTGLACTGPVVCTASGGASCGASNPLNVALATFQSGFAIPLLPANGSLTFALACTVTATGQ